MSKAKMIVGDLMTARPVTAAPWDTLATALARMEAGRFRSLPVVQMNKLIGVLSDRDVLPFLGQKGEIPVKEVMTHAVITVPPQMALDEAAQVMLRHKIGTLPVVRNDELVGIVTSTDILIAYVRLAAEMRNGEQS